MDMGINLSGAAWNLYPTQAEIDYFASKGFTTIRMPLTWEQLQPTENGALDSSVIAQVQGVVSEAAASGMKVILDIHNFGEGYGSLIGSPQTPISAFADLWGKLASQFSNNPDVIFGLMNEPQVSTATAWLPAVNAAIAAIRDAGAITQEILVPGVNWDGANSWTQNGNAQVLGAPGAIVDPSNNYAFEVHQYLDDTSGQNSWVVSESIGVERLQAITAWARDTGAKLYLGEFGVADNPTALTALDNMLKYMQSNQDVWQGGSYWAAGPSWNNYMFSVEPDLGILDQAQMSVLQKYTGATIHDTALAGGGHQEDMYIPALNTKSMSDIYDVSGNLTSRVIFNADGHATRSLVANADGTLTVNIYDGTGSARPSTIDVYSGDHILLTETANNANGSYVVSHFENGDHDASRVDTFNANGVLTLKQIVDTNGNHIGENYTNGQLSTIEIYDASWSFVSRSSYVNGVISSRLSVDVNGHNIVDQFDTQGHISVTNVYSASWSTLSSTNYDAAGNIMMSQSLLSDGSHVIDHYTAGRLGPSQTDTYNSAWQLMSRATAKSDGTHELDTYALPGSLQLSSHEVFDSQWSPVSRTAYDSQGHVASIETLIADGGHSVANYDPLTGHAVTIDLFSADWQITQRSTLDSAGNVTAIDHVGSNGGHVIDSFSATSALPTTSETYDANWTLLNRTTFDGAGRVVQMLDELANGSHTVATYGVAGSAHPSTIDTFDSSWRITARTQIDAEGHVTAIDQVQSDGTHNVVGFSATSGSATSSSTYSPDWHLTSRTSFAIDGSVSQVQVENSDGTHAIANFNAGAKQPAAIDVFNASWQIVERATFNASGVVTSIDHVNLDGTHAVDSFFGGSTIATSSENYGSSWQLLGHTAYAKQSGPMIDNTIIALTARVEDLSHSAADATDVVTSQIHNALHDYLLAS